MQFYDNTDPEKIYRNKENRLDDNPARVMTFDCSSDALLVIKPEVLALFHDLRHDEDFCYYKYTVYNPLTDSLKSPGTEHLIQDGSSFTVEVDGDRHQWEYSISRNPMGYIYAQQFDKRELFLLDARDAESVDLRKLAETIFKSSPAL